MVARIGAELAPEAVVGPVKEMIRSLDLGDLKDYLGQIETAADHSLRGKLGTYARDHGVVI